MTVRVIWLRETHCPFWPIASVLELYILLLEPLSICGNIEPPMSMPPNGEPGPNIDPPNIEPPNIGPPNGERENGSLCAERKKGSSKGEREKGVPTKTGSFSNALWRSPKSELKSSNGSVNMYPRFERDPKGPLKKGPLENGLFPKALRVSAGG